MAESLPGVVERLVRELRPYKIILFGSYAAGCPTPDSDVDLLIIWDVPSDRSKRVKRVTRAFSPRLFPVDVIGKTPQPLKQELAVSGYLLSCSTRRGKYPKSTLVSRSVHFPKTCDLVFLDQRCEQNGILTSLASKDLGLLTDFAV